MSRNGQCLQWVNSRPGLVGSLLLSKETASRQLIEGIRILATQIAAAVSAARMAAPALSLEDGGCQVQQPARIDGGSKDP
jgi:hypothetical protein